MGYALLAELQKNKEKKEKERDAIKNWLCGNSNTEYTHEVTLTFPFDVGSTDTAEKVFGTFKGWLTERCFRKREMADIRMAVTLEGGISKKRLHYHCTMQCPQHMTNDYFSQRIAKTWRDAVGNKYTRVVIKKYTDKEWLGYSIKEFKSTNTSVISEHNNL